MTFRALSPYISQGIKGAKFDSIFQSKMQKIRQSSLQNLMQFDSLISGD